MVIVERLRSKLKRVFRLKFWVRTHGMSSDASHVLFCSWPAFCHWFGKPEPAGAGTSRIWSSAVLCAYVSCSA